MKYSKHMKYILAGFMAALMVLSVFDGTLSTEASASSSEIRKQITSLQKEKQGIRDQIADLKKQYQANVEELEDIVSQKNVIDQEIGLLHTEIININEQISAFSVLIADKQDELDHAEERFDTLNEAYKERIRAMEEDGSLSYWEVLFKASSFSNLLDRLNMVEEIAASDNKRLRELAEAKEDVVTAQEELAQEKSELEVTKAELDATQAELDGKREEADKLISQLIAKGEEIEGQKEDLEREDQELLKQIAEMEKEYTKAKAAEWAAYMATYTTVPPTTVAGAITPSTGTAGGTNSTGGNTQQVVIDSNWRVPCSYKKLTSPFGMRQSPTSGASTYHQGVDLAADAGTPIYASRGGTVTSATYSGSAGYYVTINHGDGFSSIYMHMTNYVVRSGQIVSGGQLIGYVGSTGISTGNHLHFGIAYNGAYQNPCAYVGL